MLAGIPVAIFGIAGYLLMGALAWRRSYGSLLAAALVGLAFSLYLARIEAHVLGVWCIYCVISLGDISLITLLSAGNHSGASQFRTEAIVRIALMNGFGKRLRTASVAVTWESGAVQRREKPSRNVAGFSPLSGDLPASPILRSPAASATQRKPAAAHRTTFHPTPAPAPQSSPSTTASARKIKHERRTIATP